MPRARQRLIERPWRPGSLRAASRRTGVFDQPSRPACPFTSSCASPAAQAHHERVPCIAVAPLMPHTSEMLGVMQVRPVSLASPVCAASAHACSLTRASGLLGASSEAAGRPSRPPDPAPRPVRWHAGHESPLLGRAFAGATAFTARAAALAADSCGRLMAPKSQWAWVAETARRPSASRAIGDRRCADRAIPIVHAAVDPCCARMAPPLCEGVSPRSVS